jgi:hypothetical protein
VGVAMMRIWRGFVVAAAATVVSAPMARAAGSNWVIAVSGGDFTSFAAAIADARVQNGDTLTLYDSVHTENNIAINKSLPNPRKAAVSWQGRARCHPRRESCARGPVESHRGWNMAVINVGSGAGRVFTFTVNNKPHYACLLLTP